MSENKLIHIYLTFDMSRCCPVNIPASINDEVELKAYLRDLGYISSFRRSYLTTKVYLLSSEDNEKQKRPELPKAFTHRDLIEFKKKNSKEICIDKCRSLEDLGIIEGSFIYIENGEPEPRPIYTDPGSMRALYGCPMAKSVEEAMNPAEKYFDSDSTVSTGFLGKD